MPIVFSLIIFSVAVSAVAAELTVVYPKPGQVVGAVDSTFILGNVGDIDVRDHALLINNHEVSLHKDGGFLAFLPVTPGEFVFELRLFEQTRKKDHAGLLNLPVSSLDLAVTIPRPLQTLPDSSLAIAGDYRAPLGDYVLTTGDRLRISFRGTPGLQAWASIPDVADSIPMAELPPRTQPYWGESVFGAGAVPESVMVGGIYAGFHDVRADDQVIDAPVIYNLAAPDPIALISQIIDVYPDSSAYAALLTRLHQNPRVELESAYRVSINAPEYPFAVRFMDTVQIVRHGPAKGYLSIFQPEGVMAQVVGTENGWHKVKLSATRFGWVDATLVEPLPKGILPPKSHVRAVRTYTDDDRVLLEIPLSGKHPFRIIEDDRSTIRIQLFGVTSDTDWIRYDFSDPLIDLASWLQPEPDLYEFKLTLTEKIWGYDAYYTGNTFYFELKKPPPKLRKLKRKSIVIDPGHSFDPGAIGPTGLTEAEANLEIALVIADKLRRKGADVILTRDDARDLPLYDRPAIAKLHDADLFVSIHNNAVPDGVNPFTNNGVSSYYYHLHSIDLARSIQKELIKATKLPDFGLYHGNLAVARPTQYPAVLIECAFMIVPEQEALLKTDKYRKKVAGAVVKGIENFLKEFDDD
ncbi:MAG: N-acetylmuramoyl-L-alanine amidase [Candidatus Zixiibacteriota bacterium]|nr:MAG: N-acetylmuramoyl-L-alanine amidase [candidate division Zixibacteria bacterium]